MSISNDLCPGLSHTDFYEIFYRFDGARLMVVKGNKNLKHCALLDSSPNSEVEPWEDDKSAQGGEITVTFRKGEQDVDHGVEQYDYLVEEPAPMDDGMNQTSPRTKSRKNKKVINKGAGRFREKSQKGVQTAHERMNVFRNRNRQNHTSVFNTSSKMNSENFRMKRSVGADGNNMSATTMGPDLEEPPNPVGLEPDPEEELEVEDDGNGDADEEIIDEEDIRSSGSSFAKNLWSCYGGDTLFTQTFSSSLRCQSQDAMMKYALRMRTVHEITSTGYYYYIFYSDNDIVSNDIFARFNIEKVVYSFPNYTHSCINTTQCSLPLNFLSSEKVLLEVPLQDGVSDEDSLSQMILVSSCRPRLGVYFIFPVSILFLIICCAFM